MSWVSTERRVNTETHQTNPPSLRMSISAKQTIEKTTRQLIDYCRQNRWAGYDPYDALNSRIFQKVAVLNNRIGRLFLTQAMKRSPVNLRPILCIPKGENPKGLAVFILAMFLLSEKGVAVDSDLIYHLLNRLTELRSRDVPLYCWGYNFDWQNRDGLLPKFAPNIICTTFAGNALLEAFSKLSDTKYLNMAISAGEFILTGLRITRFRDDELCFSYTPYDEGQIHNANLLGASFLSRLYSLTGEAKFLQSSWEAANYSVRRQKQDGSWVYGEGRNQQWIDNFHTGYNLCALRNIARYLKTDEFEMCIHRGFKFYKEHFFLNDGQPKYYHDRTYPIDIHSVAQSIITLVEFKDLDENNIRLANTVLEWAIANMWDERGYFYYQITPYYKNKIPYIRWSQAWMLLALATVFGEVDI